MCCRSGFCGYDSVAACIRYTALVWMLLFIVFGRDGCNFMMWAGYCRCKVRLLLIVFLPQSFENSVLRSRFIRGGVGHRSILRFMICVSALGLSVMRGLCRGFCLKKVCCSPHMVMGVELRQEGDGVCNGVMAVQEGDGVCNPGTSRWQGCHLGGANAFNASGRILVLNDLPCLP